MSEVEGAIPCTCGKINIHPDKRVQAKWGTVHRLDDPCYVLKPKEPSMDFTTFVRKPFEVQAVQLTADNIAEASKLVGDLRGMRDNNPHIIVNPQLVPNVDIVFPGYYMTKMGKNIRCYSQRVFEEQFTEKTEEIQPWLDFMAKKGSDAA